MRRTFRHPTEGRTWWIEQKGRRLAIGFSSEDDPEPVERTRDEGSEVAAARTLAALVAEQLADGFVEEVAPRAPAAALFDRCLAAWTERAPEVPARAWRDAVESLAPPLRERFADELSALGPPATWRDRTWLRMQAPVQPTPFLLALREPSMSAFALWVLDAFVVPRPLVGARVESMGALDHAPPERAPHLEAALLSLLEAPTEASAEGAVALERFPYGAEPRARLRALLAVPDARSIGAARVLTQHLAHADVRVALADWLERTDVPAGAKVDVQRRLGHAPDGRPHTARTLRAV